jgi:hypothetical protein
MGIDPASLTDRHRRLMSTSDRKGLGKAGLTAAEAADQYALRTEREMHSKFSSYCGLHDILFEHEDPTRRSTSRPGWPDFRCFAAGKRFLAIDFKVRPNGLTTEQEEIKTRLEACGFPYVVAYSLSEAIHAAQQYLLK